MVKTLKISEEAHTALTKVKGELMSQRGDADLTYNDVILALVKHWKQRTLRPPIQLLGKKEKETH